MTKPGLIVVFSLNSREIGLEEHQECPVLCRLGRKTSAQSVIVEMLV